MKINNSIDLGSAIRKRRKELGYTQSFVSEQTGLSVSFISDTENGKPTGEIGKIINLVNLLGMDVFIRTRGE